MDALRRTTLTTVAACAAAAGGLWLLFGVLLEPTESTGCNTSLLDGPYKDAMLPAHLAAAGLLSWAIWRATSKAGRRVLAAIWLLVALCVAVPGVAGIVGFVGVFAGPLVGLPLLLALGIAAAANLRAHNRWERYETMSAALAWGCLVIGLPASLGSTWLEGASAFCF